MFVGNGNCSQDMPDFVARDSIARTIWGDADLILFVFSGSAAEFALNRAVDWLFFTGQIPRDPIGRLLSTAGFAADIVFADERAARKTIEKVNDIHHAIERARGVPIPEWAYRDVLYMLIYYSVRAFELLRRPLRDEEKEELYAVYRHVAELMRIPDIPASYEGWFADRLYHMKRDLVYNPYTAELYASYLRQLGWWRYQILLLVQAVLVPNHVSSLLSLRYSSVTRGLCRAWGGLQVKQLRRSLRRMIIPEKYINAINRLDRISSSDI